MIKRSAEKELRRLAREFKVVVVTGPRQSGKTTLVRAVFRSKPYVLLEEPDTRAFAAEDPRRFLAQLPKGAILDEVQRVPELLSYVQGLVDERKAAGQFILTGSCNFRLMESITQSLAGRAAILELFPLSLGEVQRAGCAPGEVDDLLFKGLYPALYDTEPRVTSWHNAYIRTYLERDVRQLMQVKDAAVFQRFLGLCAANIGQLLNTARLGADCGVHHNTVRAWLSILEASYLIFRLQPHHRNFRKRLVKTPKLYFFDTGLASRLLGIESAQQLTRHPLRGQLFENWGVTELWKSRANRGMPSNLFFWRNHVGLEVDVVADHGKTLLPVEFKAGATVASDWFSALEKWKALAKDEAEGAWVVHGGEVTQKRRQGTLVSWKDIQKILP